MTKLIFLDIDGVLNNLGSMIALGYPSNHLDPVSVALVAKLCDEADAGIVVSSTWRIGRTVDELRDVIGRAGGGLLANHIKSKTGYENGTRGEQIQEWLQRGQIGRPYIIIDDDGDMLPHQKPFFVQTRFEDGFRAKHYVEAMKILSPQRVDTFAFGTSWSNNE